MCGGSGLSRTGIRTYGISVELMMMECWKVNVGMGRDLHAGDRSGFTEATKNSVATDAS